MSERRESIRYRFQLGIHAGQCSIHPSVLSVLQWGRLGRLILVSWVSWFLTGFGQWETLGRQWGREVEGELRIFLFAQLSLSVSGSNCISSKAPVPTSLPLLPWSPLLDELYYGSSPCWRAFASAFQQCQPSCCVHSCRGNSLCAVFILWVASSFHLAS